jgi:hypothetical protein
MATKIDGYALEQAYALARSELASYHEVREQIHRKNTRGLKLVQLPRPVPRITLKARKNKARGVVLPSPTTRSTLR